jgi:hypothetical protein
VIVVWVKPNLGCEDHVVGALSVALGSSGSSSILAAGEIANPLAELDTDNPPPAPMASGVPVIGEMGGRPATLPVVMGMFVPGILDVRTLAMEARRSPRRSGLVTYSSICQSAHVPKTVDAGYSLLLRDTVPCLQSWRAQ